ncbi:MAG: P-II family nitrogen regulator [Eubacteriales bacterium]|nr:P-II family nitrogen regulator [Eubacteriales bacterium]MDD3880946.1 P-II family nitrogen regulator [Eubacteriales bacterium]MDD4511984.1 P-II family nitrogen regulator [Eubacteriales bacterium]
MNYVLTVTTPELSGTVLEIIKEMNLPLSVVLYGRGTATKSMMDFLGIDSKERRVIATIATEDATLDFIRQQMIRLNIGVPGNGIVTAIPIKSVGGGRTLEFLGGSGDKGQMPIINYNYEMIIVIANEGYTADVMDAARLAGAAGGTILHGKGTNSKEAEEFFKVSLASEKEVLLIVSRSESKAAIMQEIIKNAGPQTRAGAIVFSLPISAVAGLSLIESTQNVEEAVSGDNAKAHPDKHE